MLIGDDHAAVEKLEEPIQKALGCHIYQRKMFYRKEGYDAVSLSEPFLGDLLLKSSLSTKCHEIPIIGWRQHDRNAGGRSRLRVKAVKRHDMRLKASFCREIKVYKTAKCWSDRMAAPVS